MEETQFTNAARSTDVGITTSSICSSNNSVGTSSGQTRALRLYFAQQTSAVGLRDWVAYDVSGSQLKKGAGSGKQTHQKEPKRSSSYHCCRRNHAGEELTKDFQDRLLLLVNDVDRLPVLTKSYGHHLQTCYGGANKSNPRAAWKNHSQGTRS